jgi:exonuclease III
MRQRANDRNREELYHLFRLEILQKHPPERIQQKRLRLITCNIEGIKSNSAYVNSLNMENTILCLQEHFLWDFQRNEMKKLVPNMGNYTICHDTNDPLNGFKLPRGQAGVAIHWLQEWNGRIKRLKPGNERIIAITVASSPEICLINAYLPAQNTNSQVEYSECLDVIFDIIVKYQNQYQIILCGDLNGTVMERRNNKHDQVLKKCITEMRFDISKQVGDLPTFFHHAHDSTLQIDYSFAMEPNTIVKYQYGEK